MSVYKIGWIIFLIVVGIVGSSLMGFSVEPRLLAGARISFGLALMILGGLGLVVIGYILKRRL